MQFVRPMVLSVSALLALFSPGCGGTTTQGPADGAVTTDSSLPSTDAPLSSDTGARGDTGSTPTEDVPDPFALPTQCSSNTRWTNGDRGSSDMHPGRACIRCHSMSRGAPSFVAAGTVFRTGHEPDDCNGGPASTTGGSAVVEVRDANGMTFRTTVRARGNFYISSSQRVTFPITAKVIYQGREREMSTEVMTGDCNSCHTEAGDRDAPGRIVLP